MLFQAQNTPYNWVLLVHLSYTQPTPIFSKIQIFFFKKRKGKWKNALKFSVLQIYQQDISYYILLKLTLSNLICPAFPSGQLVFPPLDLPICPSKSSQMLFPPVQLS